MNPTRHLAEQELVDALDGTLADVRGAHVAACRACAAQVEELRTIAARAAAVDVPEPPPFFWNQLSARVRTAVAEESAAGPRVLTWQQWLRPAIVAAAAAILIVVVSALAGVWPGHTPEPVGPTAAMQSSGVGELGSDVLADIDEDEAWALVRTMAEDLNHDEMDVEGVSARPGSADHLTLGLSEPERVELARLLEEQLKGRNISDLVS
jgi:hypothetical protein